MGDRSSIARKGALLKQQQPQEQLFDTHPEVSLGVPAAEVFFSNPVKSRDSIAYAAAKGVEWYVVDSADELRRVHEAKPDARTYLRIATPNIGADWPLSGKFGTGTGEAREIIAL